MKKVYTVPKPFSLIDIVEKAPYWDELIEFLKERKRYYVKTEITSMKEVLTSPVMLRNLEWLKTNGFLTHQDQLQLGSILTHTSYPNSHYEVIRGRKDKFCLKVNHEILFANNDQILEWDSNKCLEDVPELRERFEVEKL